MVTLPSSEDEIIKSLYNHQVDEASLLQGRYRMHSGLLHCLLWLAFSESTWKVFNLKICCYYLNKINIQFPCACQRRATKINSILDPEKRIENKQETDKNLRVSGCRCFGLRLVARFIYWSLFSFLPFFRLGFVYHRSEKKRTVQSLRCAERRAFYQDWTIFNLFSFLTSLTQRRSQRREKITEFLIPSTGGFIPFVTRNDRTVWRTR